MDSKATQRASLLRRLLPNCCRYKSPGEAYVEGDASSASYFLAGATITGGTITVEGCGSDSLQVWKADSSSEAACCCSCSCGGT